MTRRCPYHTVQNFNWPACHHESSPLISPPKITFYLEKKEQNSKDFTQNVFLIDVSPVKKFTFL